MSVADELQRSWLAGRPSSNLSAAGVLVRSFDTLTPIAEARRPWEPCRPQTSCEQYNAIWPASLVSKALPAYYAGGGFVLAPTNRFFCAYPRDGTSLQQMRIRKGPGASAELWRRAHEPQAAPGCSQPCKPPPFRLQHWAAFEAWAGAMGCSFPPEQLEDCLRVQPPAQYNEIVVDAAHLRAHLPHSLLGAFIDGRIPQSTRRAHGRPDPAREKESLVRRVWGQFRSEYGLSAAEFPLLRLTERGFEVVEGNSSLVIGHVRMRTARPPGPTTIHRQRLCFSLATAGSSSSLPAGGTICPAGSKQRLFVHVGPAGTRQNARAPRDRRALGPRLVVARPPPDPGRG